MEPMPYSLPQTRPGRPTPESHQEGHTNQRLERLVGRIASGDEDALTQLFAVIQATLRIRIVWLLHSDFDADEVLADVFFKIWTTADTYDPARGTALAWMYTLASSRALDFQRARRRRLALEEPLAETIDAFASAEAQPLDQQLRATARSAVRLRVAELPDVQRQAIELVLFEELSYAAAAARIGTPLSTLRTRVRLGMQKLQRQLAPLAV